jgi:MFS transporter, UMF1 family
MSEQTLSMPSPSAWRTASWVMYDLANTVFAATVTYLFAPHFNAAATGVTNSAAMVFAAVCTPLMASIADRTGRSGLYCAVSTLLCIGAMALFGVFDSPLAVMIALFVATTFYQVALVFYNALLPSVASDKHMGLVSGLGVGLGYIGTIFTLVIALPVRKQFGLSPAFLVTAAAFFVTALPCMLFVRDLRPIRRERLSWSLTKTQWGELLDTIKRLPEHPKLMWFLIANFFAVDALNAAILFYGKFLERCFAPMAEAGHLALLGHPIGDIQDFIMIGGLAVTTPALGYGLLLGHLADRIGSQRAFVIAVVCLSGGLVGAALFGGWAPMLFLVSVCSFGGLGLAGIWAAGRKLLTELVPRDLIARHFALYGITTKVSIIGSTVCGIMIEAFGPRTAILSQVLPLLIAFYCAMRMGRSPQCSE